MTDSLINRDRNAVASAIYRYTPVEIESGKDVYLYDVDGKKYIDFCSGICTNNVGYRHPKVLQAIKAQSEKIVHVCDHVGYYRPYVEMMELLKEVAPGKLKQGKGVFVNSGTEAVEAALKLARVATGRPCVISFLDAFHGRAMGALGVTASGSSEAYRRTLSGMFPGVYHAPFASSKDETIGELSLSSDELLQLSIGYIKKLLTSALPPSDLAAIIVEPIQGEGGYIFPHDDFLNQLRQICDDTGALLITDEIQSGMGRTGKMFAVEHWGVEPDITVLAKALGGGLPLGAVLAKKEIIDEWEPAAHGTTFGGNPVACASGKATLEIVLEEDLMDNAKRVGKKVVQSLKEEASSRQWIENVRGKGLLIGMDVISEDGQPLTSTQLKNISAEAAERGLIITKCGSSTLRIVPPLIVSEEVALQGVDILIKSVEAVLTGH